MHNDKPLANGPIKRSMAKQIQEESLVEGEVSLFFS